MKSAALFGVGLLIGAALAAIAFLSNWIPWPDPRRPQHWDESWYVDRARVREREFDIRPHVYIDYEVALDPAGAHDVGTITEDANGLDFGCEAIEMNSGVHAFHVWRGNGFTGEAAVFRFGPEREDVGLHVYSFGDLGPSETAWDYPTARIRLSHWPVDRPGTIVAFEIEGYLDGKEHALDGKFRVPGGEEAPAADAVAAQPVFQRRSPTPEVESDVRVLIDEQPDPRPIFYIEPTTENRYSARVARIPASPGVLALRYTESDWMFGGTAVTFSLGPEPSDVRVRVDELSDAGDPESWTHLAGTMWVSSKALDREGVVVELELFGTYRGERLRFHARFLTPP